MTAYYCVLLPLSQMHGSSLPNEERGADQRACNANRYKEKQGLLLQWEELV
jgi:hypothetical protein